MKYLYKYPQRAFPYADLVDENRRRTRADPEYELLDTGIFDDDRYFDVVRRVREGRTRRHPDPHHGDQSRPRRGAAARAAHALVPERLELGPTATRGRAISVGTRRPRRRRAQGHAPDARRVLAALRARPAKCSSPTTTPTRNGSSARRAASPYVKDAFHELRRRTARTTRSTPRAPAPRRRRTTRFRSAAGESVVIRLRLTADEACTQPLGAAFDALFDLRRQEADAFYRRITPFELPDDVRNVQRQAFAGMLWSKQYYRYHRGALARRRPRGSRRRPRRAGRAATTTGGTSRRPTCCRCRTSGSTRGSPPGTWRSTDPVRDDRPGLRQGAAAAAHARVVHASERPDPGLRVGVLRRQPAGARVGGDARLPDRGEAVRPRATATSSSASSRSCCINFTWWVNRKDAEGNNIFEGGFLGLDNIGVFDRTSGLPGGGHLEQADGTSWMARLLPQPAGDRARAREGGHGLRGHRDQVLRALRLHRRGDQPHRRPAGRAVGRAGRLLLRRAEAARRPLHPDPRADRSPASSRSSPSRSPTSEGIAGFPDFGEAPALVREVPARAAARARAT